MLAIYHLKVSALHYACGIALFGAKFDIFPADWLPILREEEYTCTYAVIAQVPHMVRCGLQWELREAIHVYTK